MHPLVLVDQCFLSVLVSSLVTLGLHLGHLVLALHLGHLVLPWHSISTIPPSEPLDVGVVRAVALSCVDCTLLSSLGRIPPKQHNSEPETWL